MRLVLPAAIVVVFCAVPAFAQAGSALKGITQLHAVVENLDADSTACGLDKSSVESWATKTLLDNGLQPVDSRDLDIHVRVTTLHLESAPVVPVCFSSVEVIVRGLFLLSGGHLKSVALDFVDLIAKIRVVSSARPDHRDRVKNEVSDLTEQVATEIRKANAQK